MSDQQNATLTPADRELAPATALSVTFLIAAAAWVASVWQMSGMNMGPATDLGSFGEFAPLWVSMMAAMMLPGAVGPLLRQVSHRGLPALPRFVVGYLAVWTAVGVVAYVAYRPHGSAAAGALVMAAGLYELAPVKRRSRQHCRSGIPSGFGFGISCVGSSIGLMVLLLAVGVMSVPWVVVICVLVTAQKVLAPRATVDTSLAVAIVAVGLWILVGPSTVLGL
jgi:predicted metal-binding membrane protein